jgi:hypothetical protein
MSKRFPQLDKRQVRHLLRTGMRVPSEQVESRHTLAILEELGLVALAPRRYVKCVNPDDEDYWDVPDRSCPGEIELEPDVEDGGPYECPDCGRVVEYPAVHKQVFEDLHVTVRQEGVAGYLFAALEELDIVAAVEPLDRIAARLALSDGRALVVPIVDYAGAGWRAGGPDAQKIHAYVIASSVHQPPREYLERAYHVELADILAHDRAWLAGVLDAAAQPRHTAFISYSHKDAPFVDRLAEDLVAGGVGVWLDRWKIMVGDSIADKIQTALHESDYLLLVLSPHSVSSPWVHDELNAARVRQLESRRVVVLPILYQDCDIPPLLKDKRYADCRGARYEQGLRELLAVLAPAPQVGAPTSVHWGRWRPEAPRAPAYTPPGTAVDAREPRRRLLAFICDHFDAEELRTLCFDLGVSYDDLPAQGRKNKARELIAYVERRERLGELLELLRETRPDSSARAGLTL